MLQTFSLLGRLGALGLLIVIAQLRAQSSGGDQVATAGETRPAPAEVETMWRDLVALSTPPPRTGDAGAINSETQRISTQALLERFRLAAAKAQEIERQHPDYSRLSSVRRLEAKNRLRVAIGTNAGLDDALKALVAEVRADDSLPAKERLEITAMADIVRIRPLAKSRDAFLTAHEESARRLMVEFPTEPGGYEALMRLTESLDDSGKVKVNALQLQSPSTPFAVRAGAQILLERQNLVGKALADVANTALGRESLFEQTRGQRTVLYTWSVHSPGSIMLAKEIARLVPRQVFVVGINLDSDVDLAKSLAATESLPGTQVYDSGGRGSLLALTLKLNNAPLVYVTDVDGIIREVSAQRGALSEKLISVWDPKN